MMTVQIFNDQGADTLLVGCPLPHLREVVEIGLTNIWRTAIKAESNAEEPADGWMCSINYLKGMHDMLQAMTRGADKALMEDVNLLILMSISHTQTVTASAVATLQAMQQKAGYTLQ